MSHIFWVKHVTIKSRVNVKRDSYTTQGPDDHKMKTNLEEPVSCQLNGTDTVHFIPFHNSCDVCVIPQLINHLDLSLF